MSGRLVIAIGFLIAAFSCCAFGQAPPPATEGARDEVAWGRPVDGLRIGILYQSGAATPDGQPTFKVVFENVGKVRLYLAGPLGLNQMKEEGGGVTYSQPLQPIIGVIDYRSKKQLAKCVKSDVLEVPPRGTTSDFALKPGEKREFSGIALIARQGRERGREKEACQFKYMLVPDTSYAVKFEYKNTCAKIGDRTLWTGRALTGEAEVKAEPLALEKVSIDAVFEPVKPARRGADGVREYFLGEPIYVKLTVVNKGNRPVGLRVGSERYRTGRHQKFEFEAADKDGNAVADPLESVTFRRNLSADDVEEERPVLQPGQSHQQVVLLNRWLALTRPGEYTIKCRREQAVATSEEQLKDWHEDVLPKVPIEGTIAIRIHEDDRALARYVKRLCDDLEAPEGLVGGEEAAKRAAEEMKTLALAGYLKLFGTLDALARKPGKLQRDAVTWIAYYGPECVPAVRQAVGSEDVYVRADALDVLAHYKAEGVTNLVRAALKSRIADERRRALYVCRLHPYEECYKEVLALARDPDRYVRLRVVLALEAYEKPDAVPVLLELLKEDEEHSTDIKIQAARVLGKLGRTDGVPVLIDLLRHEKDGDDRRYVARTLEDITGEEFGENCDKWAEWWQEECRKDKR